ncbi:sugar transferase [Parvimonas micra]|uniref:sugar transferase n=1 Tax=Parvimonas micra TaxID=33033 RepID=UPI0022B73B2C|nr:sugar transferase [Parvimonas micra]WBB39163.1 sugar transferase [Parvimonas micra]
MIKYKDLPKEFQNESVKKYYEIVSKKRLSLVFKRIFDIIFSVLTLIILLIPIFIISIAIKLDSKGSVFYRQERVTMYGKKFKIFKFRTMVSNADKIGTLVTVKSDSRITKVGKFLRKYRLDEFPQIFNIFLGDMSFVGTRPEVTKYVERYSDYMYATLLLPAGLTSYSSINYKDEDEIISKHLDDNISVDDIYIKYILPDKMKYNIEYIERFSFWYDIKIMFKTFLSVFLGRKNNES